MSQFFGGLSFRGLSFRDTGLTASDIMYNNSEISRVLFVPNIATNHAIICTNFQTTLFDTIFATSSKSDRNKTAVADQKEP